MSEEDPFPITAFSDGLSTAFNIFLTGNQQKGAVHLRKQVFYSIMVLKKIKETGHSPPVQDCWTSYLEKARCNPE